MTDALMWARLQFATTTSLHFLFVVLSLGLVVFVVAFQTAAVIRRSSALERMTRFWGTLYVINYGLGILTGLVMEFQFGLNWSGLADMVGNVFGAPVALETLMAFFLESVFLGMWIFGWGRLSRGAHLVLIWLVAITAYASAYWIVVANAFLQHPVGYELRDGRAYLTDLTALLTNPNMIDAVLHIACIAVLTGAVVIAGVSAWHLRRSGPDHASFRTALRVAVPTIGISAFLSIHYGFLQELVLRVNQPAKLGILRGESDLVAQAAAAAVAAYGPGDYAPPGWIGPLYQLMTVSAYVMFMLGIVGTVLLWKDWLIRLRIPLVVLIALVPLPFVIAVSGWLVREVGRQPWVVYGVLRTADAVSDVPAWAMFASFVGFTVTLAVLVATNYVVLARRARRGPDDTLFGVALADAEPAGVGSATGHSSAVDVEEQPWA